MTVVDRRPLLFSSYALLAGVSLICILSFFDISLILKKLIFCSCMFMAFPLLASHFNQSIYKGKNFIYFEDYSFKPKSLSIAIPGIIFLLFLLIDAEPNFIHDMIYADQSISSKSYILCIFSLTLSLYSLEVIPNVNTQYVRETNKKFFSWFIVIATIILFFDVNLYYDVHHYMPFVGPANSVYLGGIPLKDVFSQYGQGYLLIDLFFLFLPRTFTTAALAIFIINALQFMLYLLMLRKIIKSNTIFILFGCLAIGIWYFIPGFPHNNTPSHGGMRYLATYLLMTTIVYLPEGKKYSIFTIFSLAISIFWSFEAFINAFVIYISYLILPTIINNETNMYKNCMMTICKFTLVFCGIFILEILSYTIFTGEPPRIDFYISLIMPYLANNMYGNKSIFFELSYCTLDDRFYSWLIYVIIYTSVLTYCLSIRSNNYHAKRQNIAILRMALISIFGIITSATCILNTNKINLVVISFPLYLLLAVILNEIFTHKNRNIILRNILILPLSIYIYISLSVILRNDKPYQRLIDDIPSINSTKIRELREFCDHVNNACRPEQASGGICVNSPNHLSCSPSGEYLEAEKLVAKWQHNKRNLLMIHPWASVIAIKEGKRLFFPSSWPVVDILSIKLTEKIAANGLQSLQMGDNLIVAKEYSILEYGHIENEIKFDHNALNRLLLNKITKSWKLLLVDETIYFNVYTIAASKD